MYIVIVIWIEYGEISPFCWIQDFAFHKVFLFILKYNWRTTIASTFVKT
jgi:hypothetical protein